LHKVLSLWFKMILLQAQPSTLMVVGSFLKDGK
jgi:hypothetical protein